MRERKVVGAHGAVAVREAALFHLGDHADDRQELGLRRDRGQVSSTVVRLVHAAADRILIRPETARQPIIDHDHLRRVSSVALVEETAGDEPGAHGLEVSR